MHTAAEVLHNAKPTNLLVSHVMTLPSKPDVTRRRVLVSYSMFFTQLAWPCSEQTLEFSLRRSHNAMVVSSEQVANRRLSKNLEGDETVSADLWPLSRVYSFIHIQDTFKNNCRCTNVLDRQNNRVKVTKQLFTYKLYYRRGRKG